MSSIETSTCVFEVVDGVLYCTNKPQCPEGLAEARENVAAIDALMATQRLPMLADMSDAASQSREARAHYAEHPIATAVALLVTNPIARVLGNFYLGLNRPEVPTQLFAQREQALAWLARFPAVSRP